MMSSWDLDQVISEGSKGADDGGPARQVYQEKRYTTIQGMRTLLEEYANKLRNK